MYVEVHPSATMMRGDDQGYNPRNILVTRLSDGREVLTGTFVDDVRVDGTPRRPDRPFEIIIPADFQNWQGLNTDNRFALQRSGESIKTDFARRPQKDHILTCPTCGTVVRIQLAESRTASRGALTADYAANCQTCRREFSDAEVDELGIRQ
jgi:hypothetical protein